MSVQEQEALFEFLLSQCREYKSFSLDAFLDAYNQSTQKNPSKDNAVETEGEEGEVISLQNKWEKVTGVTSSTTAATTLTPTIFTTIGEYFTMFGRMFGAVPAQQRETNTQKPQATFPTGQSGNTVEHLEIGNVEYCV